MEKFAKQKYRRITFKRNNLFDVDLSTEEGVREYSKKYMRFYREVDKRERALRQHNRMNGVKKPVKLEESELVKLLKKVYNKIR